MLKLVLFGGLLTTYSPVFGQTLDKNKLTGNLWDLLDINESPTSRFRKTLEFNADSVIVSTDYKISSTTKKDTIAQGEKSTISFIKVEEATYKKIAYSFDGNSIKYKLWGLSYRIEFKDITNDTIKANLNTDGNNKQVILIRKNK